LSDIQNLQQIQWPYPVDYDKTNEAEYDVLVIGASIGGCYAAMAAYEAGAKVAVVDQGPIIRSGSSGTGFDHWHSATENPACTVTAEEVTEAYRQPGGIWGGSFCPSHLRYIECKESWDCLLTAEKIGVPFRDYDDEFEGARFRDDKSKILYAYDLDKKNCIRFKGGAQFKPLLKAELDRLGMDQYEFTCATSLLTEGGKKGARVVGATALSIRTGEFFVFKAKTVVMATGYSQGLWVFSTELAGGSANFYDPNNANDGHVMGLRAGAKLHGLESNHHWLNGGGGFRRMLYGTGDCHNTWYPCPIVDANGKQVPYVDADGNVVKTIDELYHNIFMNPKLVGGEEYHLLPDLPDLIRKGEYTLPLYADLTQLEPKERDALWGIMVGNEGKTNYPVLKMYNKYGFDPAKDMLEVATQDNLESYATPMPLWLSNTVSRWRNTSPQTTFLIDWNLMTTVPGLYVAGDLAGGNYAAGACATGRYAGRNAAVYARTLEFADSEQEQVNAERERIYAPVKHPTDVGVAWREFKAGLARVMQDYCALTKCESLFDRGLEWIDSLEQNEMKHLYARNPHELVRCAELMNSIIMARAILEASKARKCSIAQYSFERIDYPEECPDDQLTLLCAHLKDDDKFVYEEVPVRYYLQAPYADNYSDNYDKYCNLDD